LNEPVIRIAGVHKSFGGIVVADDVELSIGKGEILGLIGPNGAGKTSLFNLISGVVRPDAGGIFFNGRAIDGLPLHQRARLGLARTWQHMRLFKTMSVLENLLMGARDYPGESLFAALFHSQGFVRKEKELHTRAVEVLNRMKLSDVMNKAAGDLTFGQQKLVGLGRALMNGGDCLLLDEAMAGVEGASYDTMKEIVRTEAAAGRAVCVVEHNISFVQDLCNRAVFMFNGRILRQGTVEELLASEELAQLYFGH
jgi:branched-chain amino acid transport system ATP-binding protein